MSRKIFMIKKQIYIFRPSLACLLVVIIYLATAKMDIEYPVSYFDKINHLSAFLTLSFFTDFSFPLIKFNKKKIGFLIFYGILIEIIQYFIPYREFSVADILADTTGILLYIIMIPLMNRLSILKRFGSTGK